MTYCVGNGLFHRIRNTAQSSIRLITPKYLLSYCIIKFKFFLENIVKNENMKYEIMKIWVRIGRLPIDWI